MVNKNAEKRPSATEALSFPVISQKLEVQFICAKDIYTFSVTLKTYISAILNNS